MFNELIYAEHVQLSLDERFMKFLNNIKLFLISLLMIN